MGSTALSIYKFSIKSY